MIQQLPKQINYLLIIGLIFIIQVSTAQNVEKLYVNMPDAINPTLSKQNRLELLEYHKAGQGDSIDNRFGNKAYLSILDTLQQYIVVKNTPNSTFEMKLLKLENEVPAIGIIRTVCAPVCQSNIAFYDTAWNLVPLQFTMPKAIEWINESALSTENVDRKWLENLLENSFITLTFDAVKQEIIANNNSLDFVNEIDRKLVAPILFDKKRSYKLVASSWILNQ
jgi:hypothetical protein